MRTRKPAVAWSAALVLLLCALAITPWLVRNYRVFGQFVFIRDNFGMELHLANNERSGGFWKGRGFAGRRRRSPTGRG